LNILPTANVAPQHHTTHCIELLIFSIQIKSKFDETHCLAAIIFVCIHVVSKKFLGPVVAALYTVIAYVSFYFVKFLYSHDLKLLTLVNKQWIFG